MTAYLWTWLVLLALSVLAEIGWLTCGIFPARTPAMTAYNLLANLALLVWTAVLLFRA